LSSNGRPPRPFARRLRLPLRLLVAGGLTAYLLWKSHPQEVFAAGVNADWKPMAVAVLLVLLDRALMAYRWVALLCTVEPADRPSIGSLMRIFFVSTFVGTFLPASIGSDALRSYSVSRLRVKPADAVASVVMDRVLGIASILLAGLFGLTLARDLAATTPVVVALAAAAGVCVVTVLVVFVRTPEAGREPAKGRLPIETLRRMIGSVLDSIRKYAARPRVLLNVLGCSLAVQGLRIVQAYFLGRGLGIDLPAATYVALIPVILLVMLLPVTFNGIGTSQAAFVWFFGQAGVQAAPAFALSVLFVALGIVGNLPGALLYVGSAFSGQGSSVRSAPMGER